MGVRIQLRWEMGMFLDAFFAFFFWTFFLYPYTPPPPPQPGRGYGWGGGESGVFLDCFWEFLEGVWRVWEGGGLSTYTHTHYRLD